MCLLFWVLGIRSPGNHEDVNGGLPHRFLQSPALIQHPCRWKVYILNEAGLPLSVHLMLPVAHVQIHARHFGDDVGCMLPSALTSWVIKMSIT